MPPIVYSRLITHLEKKLERLKEEEKTVGSETINSTLAQEIEAKKALLNWLDCLAKADFTRAMAIFDYYKANPFFDTRTQDLSEHDGFYYAMHYEQYDLAHQLLKGKNSSFHFNHRWFKEATDLTEFVEKKIKHGLPSQIPLDLNFAVTEEKTAHLTSSMDPLVSPAPVSDSSDDKEEDKEKKEFLISRSPGDINIKQALPADPPSTPLISRPPVSDSSDDKEEDKKKKELCAKLINYQNLRKQEADYHFFGCIAAFFTKTLVFSKAEKLVAVGHLLGTLTDPKVENQMTTADERALKEGRLGKLIADYYAIVTPLLPASIAKIDKKNSPNAK